MRHASPFKVLHRGGILNRCFRILQPVAVERSTTAIVSAGVRYASNLPNDAQLVIGAALPIGLTFFRLGIILLLLIRASIRTHRASPNKITSAVHSQRRDVADAA